MSAIDEVLPTPRLVELDEIELALPVERAWELIRHGDLGRLPIARALFSLRTLPGKLIGRHEDPLSLRIDDMASTRERPGFHVLIDRPPQAFVVGAIGKVWQIDIPFLHVPTPVDFRDFGESGFIKVAWAVHLKAEGENATRVTIEVRVDATDEESWKKFRAYFLLIGKPSRFIRRAFLAALAREHGTPDSKEDERALTGDELLPDAMTHLTHGITIAAKPEGIWPWLIQMGCRRGGFYSIDALDNGGRTSAREIHPELQVLRVGDVLPAAPESDDGFEVLRIEENRALVLGGLYDADRRRQLPFASTRPDRFWQITWAFVLEPLDATHTRLHVRARAAFPKSGRVHATWIKFVHHLMEGAQLRHLAARAEGRFGSSPMRRSTRPPVLRASLGRPSAGSSSWSRSTMDVVVSSAGIAAHARTTCVRVFSWARR
jgi:hypothetical protein